MSKSDDTAAHKVSGAGSKINWELIRRRMEQSAASLNNAAAPSQAAKAAVLRARAKALARAPEVAERPGHYIEIVEFMLAYERYAVDCAFVREVHPLKDITALPGAPAFVAGIVNVRGQIVSVVDMKTFFDLPRKGLTDFNRVIILNDGQMEFGLLVDAVLTVHRLALDAIQPPLPTLIGVRANYLHGVSQQRTIILNAAKLLADPDMQCGT
jgi:purine-binding chemotaxis protein CheW